MPQVTVYLRKQDLAKWEAIEKKAEFLHNALNNLPSNPAPKIQTSSLGVERQVRSELPPLARACCLNKVKPCKHWNWTGENYTNILTGEIREVNELQN